MVFDFRTSILVILHIERFVTSNRLEEKAIIRREREDEAESEDGKMIL